ncbi:DUF3137 domain-containing protein [Demequina sp. B12]|uniref:hypothetical protein n=1 Tax=Demequina sp. B12 TaxID=2992757 RepID=UPI00237B562F|nr:hypothetical protein [Demequina sp. B12]MDE0572002.1 DUF3137 domain-containing protein [Demequina sp. B12]
MLRNVPLSHWLGPAALFLVSGVLFVGVSTPFAMLLAGVLMLAAGVWMSWDFWMAGRHRDAYATFAREHGWEYAAVTHRYSRRFREFPFDTGRALRQEAVAAGAFNGVQCATFAHVYETRAERDSRPMTIAHQVTLAELDVALPRIDIVPQGVAQTVITALGGRDVDVESHDFNRQWRVIATDARYAHAVLDPRMVERLTWDDVQGYAIRIEGAAVYVWQRGRQGPEDLAARLGIVTAIARRIPDHVLREFRELGYGVGTGDDRPMRGPDWATQSGVLNSRRYTGIGMDTPPGAAPHEPQH